MAGGKLFKDREMVVMGEPFESHRRGTAARERLRGRLSLLTEDSVEIRDAADLGTAWFGTEGWQPDQLLQVTRRRFRAARGQGDDLAIEV